jgi:hypothetical protein
MAFAAHIRGFAHAVAESALRRRRGASPSFLPPFSRRRREHALDCALRVVGLLQKRGRRSSSLLAVCPRSAHAASDGLIWPRVGCASITFPQWRSVDFLPLRDHPAPQARGDPAQRIPRETRKSPARHPPLRCGRKRCGLIALGLLIAIEAAMRAARAQTRRLTMSTIGT